MLRVSYLDIGLVLRVVLKKVRVLWILYDSEDEIYPDLENATDSDEHTECGYFGKDELPSPMTEQFNKLLKIILK